MRYRFLFAAFLCVSYFSSHAIEPTSTGLPADVECIEAGHSVHGEAFNEGPRQAAVLIPGIAKIHFPTSSESGTAQRFFEQGVGQLHGFWYLEAERSFRQSAAEDPNMAIAHWGMAMANVNNPIRARGLIDEAMKLREEHADKRERMYIEALDRFIEPAAPESDDVTKQVKPSKDEKKNAKRERTIRYLKDLENILDDYPDDLEAKAFLALAIWTGRDDVELISHYAVEALLAQVFAVDPMHPAHHYRIHLWDSERPENALESAAKCGPSSPGIAHMWHMPGHTYSKLKRYNDAAWQQEASARVDHAHLIRSRLMPDQIHNFAHNNEWLVRNLIFVGRIDDALDLARNLISLPRHPKYNTIAKGGSAKFGRQRLLQALTQYGLWDELLREAGDSFLLPTDDAIEQEQWLGWLAVAQFKAKLGKPAEGAKMLRSLQRRRLKLQTQLLDLADGKIKKTDKQVDAPESAGEPGVTETPTRKSIHEHIEKLSEVIARVAAAGASRRKDLETFLRQAKLAKLDLLIKIEWTAAAGDLGGAIKQAEEAVSKRPGEVLPLAMLVDLLWRDGQVDRAESEFQKLREVASVADIDTPLLARLRPVAIKLRINGDWRIAREPNVDLGQRPPLDELGPFRWQPYQAESWGAKNADGKLVASDDYEGRPRIMIFYLGFGCLHCIEQLHAFAPQLDEFKRQGIELCALSTESVEELATGVESFGQAMPIPLLSDADHEVFEALRCWDDFEQQPLHGTFLLDAKGRVRWQDVGHEPFTDVDFLLKESERLLKLP